MSGSGLAVEGLSLRLGRFALQGIDLRVAPGETLALTGPNGAGKSVTLETIAGFHRPRAGRLVIAGRDATCLPPERRRVSLLPQNYGLFPHLSVLQNVMLPMRAGAGRPAPGAARQAAEALLGRFGIAPLADRLPGDLSPGERQRTALARALAARPRLFLFDEPFAALDAATREVLRDELRTFLGGAGTSAVFVTHDLPEAMALADRIALIEDGRILQQGPAAEVYCAPENARVARLLGVENILRGRIIGRDAAGWRVAVGGTVLYAAAVAGGARARSADVSLAVRAEDVALVPLPGSAREEPSARIAGTIRTLTPTGALVKIGFDCGFPLVARMTRREAERLGAAPGLPAAAEIAAAAVRVLPGG
jgi:molybdate/tungstate transport system ATP-binding protein